MSQRVYFTNPPIEPNTWENSSNIQKTWFYKKCKKENPLITLKEVKALWNDEHDIDDEEFVLFDNTYRECYSYKKMTLSEWKYYHRVKKKAEKILYMIRRPLDPENFCDHKYYGCIFGRTIEDKEQLERILKRLRNQYERLISTIPNSFL